MTLNALPSSNSKYFKDADVFKIKLGEPPKCDHYFKLVKAKEAECEKCRIGFFLGVHDIVKDGHIYRKGQLVI